MDDATRNLAAVDARDGRATLPTVATDGPGSHVGPTPVPGRDVGEDVRACGADVASGPAAGVSWAAQIEAHYGVPCHDALERFHVELGLSTREIATRLARDMGRGPAERHVCRLLERCGVPARRRDEAARLRWAKGKGDDVPAKVARIVARNHHLELGPEARFRRTLRAALEELDLGVEILIADATWSILRRSEVDIPVFLLDPVSQRFCRVAVEVDSAYFHGLKGALKRDLRKDCLLQNRGWGIVRVDAAHVDSRIVAWEVAAKIADFYRARVRPGAEE